MNFRTLLPYLFIALLISASNMVCAQVYPVQASVQIQPPYSPYLTDYTSPGSQRLVLQLSANDITISDHPIKLRLTIEGLGITIRTKQNFIPQQHILSGGGVPTILYGEDLFEYFKPNNLDFAGLSRTEFLKTGKLPEGVYRFSIEVFSYNRDVQLSNRATTTAWIILNDPPLLNFPRKDTKVKILDPTNIAFTWTPRHTGSPNAAFSTEYIFKLVEIWPENRNPNDASLSQPALYEETLTQTQIVYGMQHPALLPGRKYAWSVQAHDVDGRDLFKNQGKSEVFVFQFGDALSAPENIKQDVSNATTITLSWELPKQGLMPQQYRIQYRKKGTTDNTWYERLTEQRWVTLPSLQINTSYEVQIRSEAKPQVSEYSALQYVQTSKESTRDYTCGKESSTPLPDFTSSLLLMLGVGDVITANNFKVVVTEANGQHGTFTGKGVMAVPFFNSASVNVTFSSIQVNANYELVAGEFVTAYNPGSEIARKIEEAHKIGEEKPEAPQTSDSISATTAITIEVPGVIDSIYFDAENEQIVVIDEEGNAKTYKQPIGEQSKEPMPVIITDSGGNSYLVQKDQTTGEVTVTKLEGRVLRKLDKMILEALNKYKKAIEDYQASIKQTQLGKGGGPSLFEDELEMLYADLPVCLESQKSNLSVISSNIDRYRDFESEAGKQFVSLIYEALTSDFPADADKDNVPVERVESEVCSALGMNSKHISMLALLAEMKEGNEKKKSILDISLFANYSGEAGKTRLGDKDLSFLKMKIGGLAPILNTKNQQLLINPASENSTEFTVGNPATIYRTYKYKHLTEGPFGGDTRIDSVDLEITIKQSETRSFEEYIGIYDYVENDWLANKDDVPGLVEGSTLEWYENFVVNWKKQDFFENNEISPLEWLKNHDIKTTSVKFVNSKIKNIIREFGMVIEAADSILKTENPKVYGQLATKYTGDYSGISIRYIAGTTSPSNHATGAAVDLRVPQNPMIKSKNKKHASFIEYLTDLNVLAAKEGQDVTNAHDAMMTKFHGVKSGDTKGKHDEIRKKYVLVSNYDQIGKISLEELEKLNGGKIIIKDFLKNRSELIKTLEASISTIVFKANSIKGIQSLIAHLESVKNDTIPKSEKSEILDFFAERNEFSKALTNMGFKNPLELSNYFNDNRLYDNLFFEHGFCDNNIEVYEAFNKAHKLVSKKLVGTEIGVEWGALYNNHIDGMHFSLSEDLLKIITNKK